MTHPPIAIGRLVAASLVAVVALMALGAPALAASANYVANCGVNLRTSATTDASVADVIAAGATVTASGSVTGGSWSATDCGGTSASGSSWYVITAVNGETAASLYGQASVYGATGLFSAAPPPPATKYLQGVDISHWQGAIDFGQVYASGRRFVIAKATEGIGYEDPSWATNRAGALAAGLRLSAYHYARPDLNTTTAGAVGEADWFVSQMDLTAGMLVPALDLEVHGSLSVSALIAWVKAWVGEVYADTGVRPMIYVSPSFWRTYLGDTAWFAQNGYSVLWIAHWTSSPQPSVPGSNWGGRSWTFWQYTSTGTVPGIGGHVDLDWYNGTDLTAVTYGADFDLAVAPASGTASTDTSGATSASVKQGRSVAVTVSIDRSWFTLPVSLSVSGLPATVTPTLKSSSTKGSSVSLTLATTSSTKVGHYAFTVTGTANGLTRTASATLVVTDGLPPTATAPLPRLVTGWLGSTVQVRSAWSATDPSGIASYSVQRQVNGGSFTTTGLASATATSVTQTVSLNKTYRLRDRATDKAGNTSGWVDGPSFRASLVQQTSSALTYSSGWHAATNSYASGGSLRYATSAGAWVSYTFTGRSVAWVAYRGPSRGQANVYVDGVLKATVSLYAQTYASRPIVFATSWSTSGTHTIKIVVKGTAGHPRVDVDAFLKLS